MMEHLFRDYFRIGKLVNFKKHGKQKKKKKITCTPLITRYISTVILVILVGLCIAMGTYQGKFLFWKSPVCSLGTIYANHKQFNIISLLFFDFTMMLSSYLMMKVGYSFSSDIPFQHKRLKQILSFTCSIGFLLIIAPYTVLHTIHIIGGTFVIGPLWGLALLFSIEVRPHISTSAFLFYQLILQGSILSYAIMYSMGIPTDNAAQKFGIASLMIVLWFATRTGLQNDFSLRDQNKTPFRLKRFSDQD